ncbi:MAG: hypothetical protein WED11_10860 [Natronospirillum sp.]
MDTHPISHLKYTHLISRMPHPSTTAWPGASVRLPLRVNRHTCNDYEHQPYDVPDQPPFRIREARAKTA